MPVKAATGHPEVVGQAGDAHGVDSFGYENLERALQPVDTAQLFAILGWGAALGRRLE